MYSKEYYNKNLRLPAQELRNTMTKAERKLWFEFLRSFKPKVHRQRTMGRFIVDFYIPKAKLIIEIDGSSHYGEKNIAKDIERTHFFNSLGLRVIRFTNDQVCHSFKKVCNTIQQTIG